MSVALLRRLEDISDDPAAFTEAIEAFRRRLPITEAEWEELDVEERRYAFTVADVVDADVVAQVWDAIDRAVSEGTDLETFKSEIGDTLTSAWGEADGYRLDTIFRTNVQQAYSDGRWAQQTHPAVLERRPFWRYDAVHDERTTPECEALDGTILRATDDYWNTHNPPLHFNCRSTITSLSPEDVSDDPDSEDSEDDEGPEVAVGPGFGLSPTSPGSEWKPDLGDYPAPIADILEKRLGGG